MNRVLEWFATVVVVVLVASATVAPVVALAGDGPNDMTGLPNANIYSSVPQHAADRIPDESAFYGNVMTSRSASSLELTVTTEGAANGRAQNGGDEMALQFSDELDHNRRRVAVSTSVLREALGRVPDMAHVKHSSGSTYVVPIHVEGGMAVWELRAFSTNTVTFSGEVNVDAVPASDGTSASYQVDDLDAATDPNVTFTGWDSTERDTVSAGGLSNGGTVALDVAGSSTATNAEVVFTGNSKEYAESASGMGDGSLTVNGDAEPTGSSSNSEPQITFTGDSSTNSRTVTGSGVGVDHTKSISVGGNLEPTDGVGGNPTLSVTADTASGSYNTMSNFGGSADTNHDVLGDTAGNTPMKFEHRVDPTTTGPLKEIRIADGMSSNSDYGFTVDVYVVQETPDGVYGEGTLLVDNWDPSFSASPHVVPVSSGFEFQSGTTYTLEFVTSHSDNDGNKDAINFFVDTGASGGPHSSRQGSTSSDVYDLTMKWDAQVNNLNFTDGDGHTHAFGDFTDGQTKSTTIDLQTSSTSVDFTGVGDGSIDYTLSFTERSATDSPSVDIDGDGTADASHSGVLMSGETATVELAELSTGSQSVDVSTVGGPLPSWTIDYYRVEHTENPGIDVNGDGTDDASYTGVLAPGSTATKSLPDLALTDDMGTVSTSMAPVDVSVSYTEHTATKDANVTLNGNSSCSVEALGELAQGATHSGSMPASCVVEGTNTLNVSMPVMSADAPPRKVDLAYSHGASSDRSVSYEAEIWSERYNVSRSWVDDKANAELEVPFAGEVVAVRDVDVRTNGGAWGSPVGTSFSGTTLTVELGSVNAGDTTEVRVNGSKVRVNNGSIQVERPTTSGNSLDTRFTLESWNSDSYIAVGGSSEGKFVHYLANESYSSPSEYALISANGEQELYLPNAGAGSSATVRTIPLEANPQTDVALEVVDPAEPRFKLRPGDVSGDDVSLVYHDTVSGETYGLFSASRDGYKVDSATAQSPVTLETDDDSEVFYIEVVESSGSSSSGGDGGIGGVAPLTNAGAGPLGSPYLIIIVAVVAVVGVGWASRQNRVPTWAAAGGVLLAAVLALEALVPGTISGIVFQIGGAFAGGVAQVSQALVLTGGLVLVWGAVRVIKKFTRKEEVVITGVQGGK